MIVELDDCEVTLRDGTEEIRTTGKVELAEDFRKDIEEYKGSTGLVRVGSIDLKGFATVVHDLGDEAGQRAFWTDLEELIFPEGEDTCPPCDLAIKIRIYQMTRSDFEDLDEFGGW